MYPGVGGDINSNRTVYYLPSFDLSFIFLFLSLVFLNLLSDPFSSFFCNVFAPLDEISCAAFTKDLASFFMIPLLLLLTYSRPCIFSFIFLFFSLILLYMALYNIVKASLVFGLSCAIFHVRSLLLS